MSIQLQLPHKQLRSTRLSSGKADPESNNLPFALLAIRLLDINVRTPAPEELGRTVVQVHPVDQSQPKQGIATRINLPV